MRFPVSVVAAIALAGVATAAASQSAPQRKPGWWDVTVRVMGFNSKVQVCTDARTEAAYPATAGNPGDRCSPAVNRKTPQGWAFSTTCQTPNGPSRTNGVVTGDFQSSYHVEATTQVPGMPAGMGPVATRIDGKYLGACPAPRKPGEMVMNGKVTDLMKGVK